MGGENVSKSDGVILECSLKKIALKIGSGKHLREKVKKQKKMLKMLLLSAKQTYILG